jgi:SNF2 family DNA or RNA helicase
MNLNNFDIPDSIIYQYASSNETYKKGLLYNSNHRVLNFYFNPEKMAVRAVVRGTHDYDVHIYFDNIGRVKQYECDCPAYYTYYGACKHVVAVMKKAQSEIKNYIRKNNQNEAINDVFSFFDGLTSHNHKQEVQLEITYDFQRDYHNRYISSMEFRIGTGRLYVLRNIKEFLAKVYDSQPFEFGKNFIFDPAKHAFLGANKEIINILLEIYENEKLLEQRFRYTYEASASVFSGKKLTLSTPYLLRIFKALGNTSFYAKILDSGVNTTSIVEDDLPLNFSLSQQNNNMLFSLQSDAIVTPLTEKGIYFYCGGKIYHPSEKQQKLYLPFISRFFDKRNGGLYFPNTHAERFVSEVLPHVRKIGCLQMDPEIEKKLVNENLVSKIYFDKYRDGISAVINFHYGENTVNPFSSFNKNYKSSDKIVLRDVASEKNIISLFEASEFVVDKDRLYLDDEEKIYVFVNNILPKLQELSEVYYSDDFKNINVKYPSGFSGGIRLNQQSNILEFSFEYEDISHEELADIFSSIKEKKKYFRLKDGSFLALDNPEMERMSDLIDKLDITGKDLSKKVIELPKYRAMYLDSLLEESELMGVERDKNFSRMVQNIKQPGSLDFEIPEKLKNILRDYQKVGYKWFKTLSAYGLSGILADDMGLGKTLQVISFVLSEKDSSKGPSLVVAPTSLIYNWQNEVKKFVPELNVLVVSGLPAERKELLLQAGNADLVVTSYPLLRRDIGLYKDIKFHYCFLDEAQHIKNPNTLNAKTVKQIKSEMNFALTGTPIENSITELWSIFDYVMPGYLLSHPKFVKKFEVPIMKHNDKNALKDLSKHISPFILRRLKKDVLSELPDKIESKLTCEMTPEQKKIYLAYLQKSKKEISLELESRGFEKSHIKILALLTRLRQICCHPSMFIENFKGESGKMQLLEEILSSAFDSGHRVLLFSQFTGMLEIVKQSLNNQGIEYFYLDGSTKAKERLEMVDTFNRGSKKLFLISLKAGGTGLNLTGADMVIHFDPWWNPAVEDQASDRAHRIGQKNVVQVMKLITRGTIEDKIFELQQKKKEIIDSVIKPGETLLSKMTESEIRELFEL